ncbi:MAG: class I SAM-dependent methyltransferase [bacterium]
MKELYEGYDKHFMRTRHSIQDLKLTNMQSRKRPEWLTENYSERILDIGCGWGNQLQNMWIAGYRNLVGIDLSENMCMKAKENLPEEIEIICTDAFEYLADKEDEFGLITMFHFIEHMTIDDAIILLKLCKKALKVNGAIVILAPNMANIISIYGRYIDATHLQGYTEWSIYQVLDLAGFSDHQIMREKVFSYSRWKENMTMKRFWRGLGLRYLINKMLHEVLYFIANQTPRPTIYSITFIVKSWNK